MRGSERRRLSLGVGALLGAVALLLASPAQPQAASADCGENSGSVCWENESCVDILFYEQCTTEYRYYPRESSDGGSSTGDGDGSLLDDVEDGDCQWGDDYIGWEPRDC